LAPKAQKRPTTTQNKPQPGRDGKVQVKAWVEPEFRKQLKSLALELDTSLEALVIQQLEALLRKHGKR
jgi:hypothetical protein